MIGWFAVQTAAERLAAAREGLHTPFPERLMGLVGMATMLAIAWGLSVERKRVNWRLVGMGVALQAVFGAKPVIHHGSGAQRIVNERMS